MGNQSHVAHRMCQTELQVMQWWQNVNFLLIRKVDATQANKRQMDQLPQTYYSQSNI